MSLLRLTKVAQPATPSANKVEIFFDTLDDKVKSIDYNGTVTTLGTAAAGDVTGPASSTDHAVARFVAAGGKTLQNSVVTIDDTGVVAGAAIPSSCLSGIKFGANSIADGATITHGFASAPTAVVITGSVETEFVAVTAIAATTFTVAIKTNLGEAGTTQTIYWMAIK